MQKTDLLKQKGFRLTKPRKEILNVLEDYPFSVQEIYQELSKRSIEIDLASVYRSLELFVNMGFVQKIELGEGKKRYELVDENKHHHHLVCNNCGVIEDVEIDEESLITEAKNKSTFKIEKHNIEFFGLCVDCQ